TDAHLPHVAGILKRHVEIRAAKDLEGDEGERTTGQGEEILSVRIERKQGRYIGAVGESHLGKQVGQRLSSVSLLIDRIDVEDERGEGATLDGDRQRRKSAVDRTDHRLTAREAEVLGRGNVHQLIVISIEA